MTKRENRDSAAHPKSQTQSRGLTKREYIATIAMQGLLAYGEESSKFVATEAVAYADDLLEELAKK